MTYADFEEFPTNLRTDPRRTSVKPRTQGRGRLRVQMDDVWFPITAFDATGFEVPRDVAPKLRGLVSIYDGSRLLHIVLVMAAEPVGDAMRYEFKRATVARTTAPLDYVTGAVSSEDPLLAY